ncbi:MAG: acetylglutamate kinase [Clostridia bacterium]|nr:acetylglutamate kinase [Clostridia bacterium]
MSSHIERAKILVEALPYIQKYYNKTVVIKYGGNAMINEELKQAVINDIVLLSLVGVKVVVVHGGGPEITAMFERVGKESKFVNGLRYTDDDSMDLVQMVLAGKLNKEIVSIINKAGGRAIGLCGIDGGLFKAEKLTEDGFDYGRVGEITEVDTSVVNDALSCGFIPVISTVAQGEDGSYNINADTAAAKLASALKAEKVMLLTDIAGLMMDPNDPATLIRDINVSEIPRLQRDGVISGGMIPKIDCCVEAVRQGVKQANILDGRVPHSILMEMLSDEGIGTMIYGERCV